MRYWMQWMAVWLAGAGIGLAQTTYYVSTNGSSANSGLTTAAPWDSATGCSALTNGNTIVVMPGLYTSKFEVPQGRGPGTLKSQYKWRAIIANEASYGIGFDSTPYSSNIVVDGFCITNVGGAGIAFNCHDSVIRNCWIAWASAGYGNVTDGITASAPGNSNNVYELNLVEYTHAQTNDAIGHGIYVGGPNHIVRNNVVRYCEGYGLHFYEGYAGSWLNNCQVYNNLVYGETNNYSMAMWSAVDIDGSLPGTNYVFGNTFLNGVYTKYGQVCWTNNTILPSVNDPANPLHNHATYPAVLVGDYNLGTNAILSSPHEVLTNYAGLAFENPAKGLYWETFSSGTRNRAYNVQRGASGFGVFGTNDFFGRSQSLVQDIGAFQYSAIQAVDTRTLDPSPVSGADYWSLYQPYPVLAMLGGIKINGGFKLGNGQSPASAPQGLNLANLPGEVYYGDIYSKVTNSSAVSPPSNASVVKWWGDLSPNVTNTLMQLGGVANPVYFTAGGPTNGPCITFTNPQNSYVVDGYLTNAFSGVTFPQPITIFLVMNDPSCCNGDNQGVLFDSYSVATPMQMISFHPDIGITAMNLVAPTSTYLWYGTAGDDSTTFGWPYDTWAIVTIQLNGAGSQVFINGQGPRHTTNYGPNYNAGANGLVGFTLGNSPQINQFTHQGFYNPSRVSFATVIICTGSSYTSGSLRQQVEEALGAEHGISVP